MSFGLPSPQDIFTGDPDPVYVKVLKRGLITVINNLESVTDDFNLTPKEALKLLMEKLIPLNFVELLPELEGVLPYSEIGYVDQHMRAYAALPWYAAISDFYTVAEELVQTTESEGRSNIQDEEAIRLLTFTFNLSPEKAKSVASRSSAQHSGLYADLQACGITHMLQEKVSALPSELYPVCLTTSAIPVTRLLVGQYREHLETLLALYASLTSASPLES